MKYLETQSEKKAFAVATITMIVILILCFFLGMTYMDPPPENGIAINFGTTDSGEGDIQPTEELAPAASKPVVNTPTPATEEVITQDEVDAPVIAKEKPNTEQPKQVEKVKPSPAPLKPSKSTSDALNSILNGESKSDGKAEGGEGKSGKPGDEGDPNGSLSGDKKGSGNRDTGAGNYNLAGRKVLTKPAPRYTCNEQGTVVIQITVDQSGKVIKAERGRGTTNSAQCLFEQAKQAAMTTRFDAGTAATQVGTIKYNFTLTE